MQAAVSSVEHDTLSTIERSIPVLIRNRWLDALSGFADPERKMTLLEYLQEPRASGAARTKLRSTSHASRSCGAPFAGIIGLRCRSYRPLLHF
jgi:hypothetical protein